MGLPFGPPDAHQYTYTGWLGWWDVPPELLHPALLPIILPGIGQSGQPRFNPGLGPAAGTPWCSQLLNFFPDVSIEYGEWLVLLSGNQ